MRAPGIGSVSPNQRLIPSLTHWLWLLVTVVLLSEPWVTKMVASDGDACFHWRVGEWMLQHRQVLRADVFSHSQAGKPYISKEWLSELVFAAAGRMGGLFGIAAVGALVIATVLALLHRQLLRDGNDVLVATGIVLLTTWGVTTHALARPHVFSFLMMFLWHESIREFNRTGHAKRLIVSLSVLALVWVNVHGAILAGFIVLGAYGVGALFDDRKKFAPLFAAGMVALAATMVNPNGWRLHAHMIEFLRSEYLTNWLAEYASTDFHKTHAWGFVAWLALLFVTLAMWRPRLRMGESVLLMVWTYFALYSGRNIPLLAILSAPILAPVWSARVTGRWKAFSDRIRERHNAGRGWPVVLGLAAAYSLWGDGEVKMPEKDWPVRAVQYIRENPGRFGGPMFNDYLWGGYLMQYLPEHRVFIDGRTDFYGEALCREFGDVTGLATNWMDVLDRYGVEWTLVPRGHRLNVALGLVPGWEREHEDEVTVVFRRELP
jgi:hypothetical protein